MTLPDGSTVPSWTLSEAKRVGPVLRAPPGGGCVIWINGRLTVVFEGGACIERCMGFFLRDSTSAVVVGCQRRVVMHGQREP